MDKTKKMLVEDLDSKFICNEISYSTISIIELFAFMEIDKDDESDKEESSDDEGES